MIGNSQICDNRGRVSATATWRERLEDVARARSDIRDALEALERLGEAEDLRDALADIGARLDVRAEGLRRGIEALEEREERAMEREYRRSVLG